MTDNRKGRRSGILAVAAVGLALAAFIGFRVLPEAMAALDGQPGAATAPDFQLRTLEGEPVSLASLEGQVVLVNFWATWCPPCRLEMPGFQRVYDLYRDRGFTIVGISTDRGGPRQVESFLLEKGITYPVAMASMSVVRDFGGVAALPMSFLIDRQGRIRQTVRGIYAEDALRAAVHGLVQEP